MSRDDLERTERRVRGWDWVATELRALAERSVTERARLLGPDRGE